MAAMTDSKALGVHSMWGFSPAVDLLEKAPTTVTTPLRILVARPSDIRHVLVSISRRRRHKMPPIHFVVVENELEVLARHLLLLQVVCDWELPIRQRATVFLELFANTLVQERTQRYIHRLGQELVELVCDEKGSLADIADLSSLKYRERDMLVDVFKSWDPKVPYDGTYIDLSCK
jgi:dynein assembly factor 3